MACVQWLKGRTYYAVRNIPNPDKPGKQSRECMHRFLLGLERSDKREGEHEDGSGLNNTSGNLRIATRGQNECNKVKQRNNTSGYKGVSWSKSAGKWCAMIKVYAKQRYLGSFEDKERAHLAYCEAALRLHGEFGNTGLAAPFDKPATAVLMYRVRFTYPHIATLGAHAVGVLFHANA